MHRWQDMARVPENVVKDHLLLGQEQLATFHDQQ
jgi:hypothetical protein